MNLSIDGDFVYTMTIEAMSMPHYEDKGPDRPFKQPCENLISIYVIFKMENRGALALTQLQTLASGPRGDH